MSKNLLISICLVTLATTSGAFAANKVVEKKPPPPPDYFPLRANYWWKHQSTTGEGKQTKFDIKVVSAEKQPDETIIYAVDTMAAKTIHDWYSKPQGWVVRQKEAYGDDGKMVVNYDPYYKFIKNPLNNEDTFDWKGKGLGGIDIEESAVVSGPEDVFVPAGKFSTMKVVVKVKQYGAEAMKTYWFADWVGLIKSATQSGPVGSVTELLDYSFKKPPTK